MVNNNSINHRHLSSTESRMICIDQNKISQVFRNLIANAIKFSSPGDVVLVKVIEVEKEKDQTSLRKLLSGDSLRLRGTSFAPSWRSQKFVRFEFIDTGVGIRQVCLFLFINFLLHVPVQLLPSYLPSYLFVS